jgi:RNA recognition motif-containing protein
MPSESRGYGFLEMPNLPEAQAAIRGLNGAQLCERSLDSKRGSRAGRADCGP